MLKRLVVITGLILVVAYATPVSAGDFYLKVDPSLPPGDASQGGNVVIVDDQIEEQRSSHEEVAIETALSQFEDAEIDLEPVMSSDPNFQNKLTARRQLEVDRQHLIADMQARHTARIAEDRAHIRDDIALLQQLQSGVPVRTGSAKPANVSAQQTRQTAQPIRPTTGTD